MVRLNSDISENSLKFNTAESRPLMFSKSRTKFIEYICNLQVINTYRVRNTEMYFSLVNRIRAVSVSE